MAICKVVDFARRRAIITGTDILIKQVANGSILYHEVFDYEHGHSDDPALHASIARQVIRIALCTAAKLTHSPPPSELVENNILYIDGKQLCDLREVQFKLVQMTVDGKTVIIPTSSHYIVVTSDTDGREIKKTEITFNE